MSLFHTMRALTFTAHGGPEQLVVREDLPRPSVHATDGVRVRIHAAALNRLDLWAPMGPVSWNRSGRP
jgi:NADPH:quinone reductase-like Zn-dependent oxidoreductase